MGKRQLKSEDVDGFVLAFWDEVRSTEQMYGVRIVMDIRPGRVRGGLGLHASATRVDEEGAERPVGAADVQWPTHSATSLHALLYALALRINVAVQHDYRERTGSFYSSPTD